jgi:hypothetical protein
MGQSANYVEPVDFLADLVHPRPHPGRQDGRRDPQLPHVQPGDLDLLNLVLPVVLELAPPHATCVPVADRGSH